MWNIIGSFIDQITLGIKVRLLTILLKIISGLRILILLMVAVIVSAIMSMISAFVGIMYAIHQYVTNGHIVFDGVIIFCIVVFAIFLFIFLMLMCEKRWIKMLKIDRMILEAINKDCR
ncbi:MAG: hypothetical protein NTY22_05545 [Proteobacteria bacterium]|nr:hypothetical protein [Pseudomonadota bacterium]